MISTRTAGPARRPLGRPTAHAIAVAGLAGVFAYQGLVPKVWKVDGEVAIWQALGIPPGPARPLVRVVGALEASFAVATVAASNRRWPFLVAMGLMPMVALAAARADRSSLTQPFGPVSLALAVTALAGVALATAGGDNPKPAEALRAGAEALAF